MKKETKIAKLAALLGVEAATLVTTAEQTEVQSLQSREAEAVLEYVHRPQHFKKKVCSQCSEPFLVDLASVGYCSDPCRVAALESIGIIWRKSLPSVERYQAMNMNVPLVISPETFRALTLALNQATGRALIEVPAQSNHPTNPTPYTESHTQSTLPEQDSPGNISDQADSLLAFLTE